MIGVTKALKHKTLRKSTFTHLKNKIENNSTWEGAFYQSEWVKINQVELFSLFHIKSIAANISELFCMAL